MADRGFSVDLYELDRITADGRYHAAMISMRASALLDGLPLDLPPIETFVVAPVTHPPFTPLFAHRSFVRHTQPIPTVFAVHRAEDGSTRCSLVFMACGQSEADELCMELKHMLVQRRNRALRAQRSA
jgi:hypothetical protein